MSANSIDIQELSYRYPDGTEALKKVSLGIPKGKTTAILGGNGAGKSTLLLTLNGILRPSSGQVCYEGSPLDYSAGGLNRLRERVGIVFQSPDAQLFSASVVEDISFGLYNMKLAEEEIRRRVDEAMRRTGIEHLAGKPVHSLSFGEKKRAAIAGVLAMRPSVLVLDEPTAGLDPKGVSSILGLLREAVRDLGMTLVIATHDLDTVALYAHHCCIIEEGRVVLRGEVRELFEERETVRNAQLRLTRIGHLMEILKEKDGFDLAGGAMTIAQARAALKAWRAAVDPGKKQPDSP